MKTPRRASSSRRAPTPPGPADPVAQGARQPAEHARVEQEHLELDRQPGHHVLRQVLAEQAAARPRAAQDAPPLLRRPATGRQVEQLEASRPALRPPREHREVGGRDRVVVDVAEQLLDLPRPEPEVVRGDLEQLVGEPQAREVEPGRDAGRDDEREPRRRVVDEPPERGLGRGVLEVVEVVDHEQDRPAPGARSGLEVSRRILDRRPAAGDRRARRPRATPRGGGRRRPPPRPTTRRGTRRPRPRSPWRTGPAAWSCRSPRAPRRGSGACRTRPRPVPRCVRAAAGPGRAWAPGPWPGRPSVCGASRPRPRPRRARLATALSPWVPSPGRSWGGQWCHRDGQRVQRFGR